MMPPRNAICTHAQGFIVYDKLLLPILKAFAQYTQYLLPEMLYVCSLCVVAKQSVTVTNSSRVIRPVDSSLRCPAGIILWSVCIIVHGYQYSGKLCCILEVKKMEEVKSSLEFILSCETAQCHMLEGYEVNSCN
jgi:hypothetical protein